MGGIGIAESRFVFVSSAKVKVDDVSSKEEPFRGFAQQITRGIEVFRQA